MPKVLRIINRLNLGGPTYNAALLSSHLAPEFETLLVAGMKDDTEESSEYILQGLNVTPQYIRSMHREINIKEDMKAYRDITRIIREFKPDIVHTHAAKAGTLGRIAAFRMGVPVIVHTFHGHVFHGYFSKPKTRLFIEIERWLARISTGIIAISEEQKKDLSATYKICSSSKIKTIPLGFDLKRFTINQEQLRSEFRKKFNLSDEIIAVGIIGRLVGIKNHPMFLRAWKRILEKHDGKVHAFIIGDGEDRLQLENLCRNLGINFSTPEQRSSDAGLTFTSWILQIEQALAGLDIVALTSNNEGTPVSLIEAQAAGKPIVSTRVGGVADAVIANETALLVEANDDIQFFRSLDHLIGNHEERTKMKLKGPAFAMRTFHVDRLVRDTADFYRELLKRK